MNYLFVSACIKSWIRYYHDSHAGRSFHQHVIIRHGIDNEYIDAAIYYKINIMAAFRFHWWPHQWNLKAAIMMIFSWGPLQCCVFHKRVGRYIVQLSVQPLSTEPSPWQPWSCFDEVHCNVWHAMKQLKAVWHPLMGLSDAISPHQQIAADMRWVIYQCLW